jgi:hypothetical protein
MEYEILYTHQLTRNDVFKFQSIKHVEEELVAVTYWLSIIFFLGEFDLNFIYGQILDKSKG